MSARVLNPPQSRVMRVLRDVERDLTLAVAFSRGVGKSQLIRWAAYYLISKWEYVPREAGGRTIYGVRIVFLMPTFKQFRDIHARQLLQELAGEFAALGASVNRSTFTVEFPGGSWIQVFPASDHGSKRALGMRCDVVLLDEADDIEMAVYEIVVAPWFTEPWTLNIRIASGTPRRGRRGLLFKLFDAGRIGERVRAGKETQRDEVERETYRSSYSFHATWRDAPQNVSEQAAAAARVTMTPAAYKREWECDFDSNEGLVYGDVWVESFHVRPPPPLNSFNEFHVGMDHGWVDAGVLLLGGVRGHGEDAEMWVLEEHYSSETPNHVWDERAKKWSFAKFWPDPSRPDRIHDLRSAGLNVGETDNEIEAGVARVADLLFTRTIEQMGPAFQTIKTARARLYVAPQCVNTIREFGLYKRKPDRLDPDRFTEEILDRDNHAMDALRYMAIGRFGRMPNRRTETQR